MAVRPNFNVPNNPGYNPHIGQVLDAHDEVNAESVNRIFRQLIENVHYVFMNRVGHSGKDWIPTHGHNFSDITGRAHYNQLPIGTGANQVARGNHTHIHDDNNPVQGTTHVNGQVNLGFHPSHVTHQVEVRPGARCECPGHHTNIPQVTITRNANGFSVSGLVYGLTQIHWTAWRP